MGSENRRPLRFWGSRSSAENRVAGISSFNGRPEATACGAKLQDIKVELRRRMHWPIPEQGKWLRQIVGGHFAYFAVPTNIRALTAFRYQVIDLWQRCASAAQPEGRWDLGAHREVSRRSSPQAPHPSSMARCSLRRQTPKVGATCGKAARVDLCGGRSVTGVPTAITQRQPGWPFRRSRREDDCRGPRITQAIFA